MNNIFDIRRISSLFVWTFIVLSLVCGAMLQSRAALAQAAKSGGYAVLIVGDESKSDMLRAEKQLISEITKVLSEKNDKGAFKYQKSRTDIQVLSYHINHEREKQFCEKRLNILSEDLLFLGVISLDGKRPKKVVYRIDRIINEGRAAADIFSYTEELLADKSKEAAPAPAASPSGSTKAAAPSSAPAKTETKAPEKAAPAKPASGSGYTVTDPGSNNGETSASVKNETKTSAASAPSTPPAVNTASAPKNKPAVGSVKKYAPVPEGKYLSCQLGAFSSEMNALDLVNTLKAKGYSARLQKFSRSGGAAFYRVYSGSYTVRSEAEEALQRLKNEGYDKAILVTLDK
ncbi:SPOR domain-containing protein [bacterium]|nr:SPOR domain-containing protein [bacterium]